MTMVDNNYAIVYTAYPGSGTLLNVTMLGPLDVYIPICPEHPNIEQPPHGSFGSKFHSNLFMLQGTRIWFFHKNL
jgi:hypothetical protein